MTAPNINQLEQSDAARDRQNTADSARGIAAAIAQSLAKTAGQDQGGGQGVTSQDITPLEQDMLGAGDILVDESGLQPDEGGGLEPDAGTKEIIEEIIEEISDEDLSKLTQALTAAGVTLGVKIDELPSEAQGPFMDALEQVQIILEDVVERETSAREQQMAMEEFGKRLEQNPDRVLLAIGLTRPDIFKQVVDIMAQAEEDPRVKDLIERELKAEVALAEVERRDKAYTERDIVAKARVVTSATKRAALKYDVPFTLAEKVVAAVVRGNDGDLDPGEVDAIVKDLKGAGAPPAGRRIRRVVASQRKSAASDQPPPPPGTVQGAPDKGKNLSPGLTSGQSKLRQLVGQAASKISQSRRQ